jgi:RND family efflux transporter MFP subunit
MHKLPWSFVLLVSAIAVAVSITGCTRTKDVEARTPSSSDYTTVAVAKASIQDLSHGLVLTAEFRPFQEIDVMAKVAGYIKKINVDVGDRVKQGQLLAILEIPEMANDQQRAQASIERSQSEVARSRDELKRAESAHEIAHLSFTRLAKVAEQKPGLIAQQEIDDARARDLGAEAQVSGAKSALAGATQQVSVNRAELGKVNTLFEYTRVTAPFAGVITKRYADTGSMIQAGTASQTQAMPVVRLSQNSLLRLILPVPESAVPTVHLGQSVSVRVPTLDRTFPGRVARFADKVSLATRTMDTEVDVPNPTLVLVPGMYAEVNLTLAQRKDVLSVPVTAVDLDAAPANEGGESRHAAQLAQVMVVGPDNKIEVRRVSLGLETASLVEVRSGLNKGDLVVIGGRSSLQPGQPVRPKITTLSASGS